MQYGMYYNLCICRHLQNRCGRRLARVSVIGGNVQDVYWPLMISTVNLELHQTRHHFTLIKTFSLVLLATVDHKYQFFLVDVGAFGSVRDAGIFSSSKIGRLLAAKTLNIPEYQVFEAVKLLYVIVGNAAFPIRVNMMCPFPGKCLLPDVDNFNRPLSHAQMISDNDCTYDKQIPAVQQDPHDDAAEVQNCDTSNNYSTQFHRKNHKNRLLSTSNSPEWIRRRRNRASANDVPLNPPLGNGCYGSQQAITYTPLFHTEHET